MYFDNQNFEHARELARGEYENCLFTACDWSEAELKGITFIDCSFACCNLTMGNVTGSSFQNCHFSDCKIMGVRFDGVNPFGFAVGFTQCQLQHSTFMGLKLRKTIFRECQMEGVDFSSADLTGALFDRCRLSNAVFDNTVLEKADFRTATGYSIDPEQNKVKMAKFALSGLPGLLQKYAILIDLNA